MTSEFVVSSQPVVMTVGMHDPFKDQINASAGKWVYAFKADFIMIVQKKDSPCSVLFIERSDHRST